MQKHAKRMQGEGNVSIRVPQFLISLVAGTAIMGTVLAPSLAAQPARAGETQRPFELRAWKPLETGPAVLFAAGEPAGDIDEKATIDTLSKSAKGEVDEIIRNLMSQGKTPGLELSIQKDGKTIYECGYGAIAEAPSPGSNVLPGPNTRFQIDSLTKTFTAFAVLRLIEQSKGKIELDQPMGKYLSLPQPSWNAIPIRSYLGMITGIPDGGTTNGTYRDVIGSAAVKSTSYGIGLDFEPGSKYEYSNTNFFILGELVSAASPQHGFMPFTKENVLEPLGMTDTGFIPFGSGDLWPTPYDNGKATDPRKPNAGFSGGGFVSTMSDLEKYAIGLYNRSVLSPKSYQEMWTRTVLTSGTNKNQSINFGLGWDDVSLDAKGDVVRVSKNGGGWGWGSQLTFFPKAGYSVILLRNSDSSGNLPQAAIDIEDALTGLPSSAKPALTVDENVTNSCGGTLYVSGSGFTAGEEVTITVKSAPGSSSPQKLGFVGRVGPRGRVRIQIPYSFEPFSGLPGCRFGSTATALVTIVARDQSGDTASTEIYLRNCGISWTACPA
jgi:CubicO group peptidase (beta-lactamase class C family)